MTFQDDMADDITDVFLETDEFAVSATYTPTTQTGYNGSGFTITACVGDVEGSVVNEPGGSGVVATRRVLVKSTDFTTGLAGLAISGRGSLPVRGDKIAWSGAFGGTYKVESYAFDIGGGLNLEVRADEMRYLGAEGVVRDV